MNVLVTGGAGFIGSHLTDRLVDLGHKVTVLDDLSNGSMENINKKADFVHWDVSNLYFCGTTDYIFHLAAIASVPYSLEHPTKTHRVNVDGTYNVLKSGLDSKVKKVIFASSAAIYGNQALPYREDMTPHPISPYAMQKAIGEWYCRMFDEVYGIPTLSLRFANVYGSRCKEDSNYALLISKFKKLKKEGKPLTIFGDGEQTRDFIYVEDVVDALIAAMDSPVRNEAINISSGKAVTVNRIADIIGGEKQYFPKRDGDAEHTLLDNKKAFDLLKWEPRVPIEKGINSF